MAKMLSRELTLVKQLALASLAQHPGFSVLEEIMEDACTQATQAVIKLDPISENYNANLVNLQVVARSTNDFCSSVLKSVKTHVGAAVEQEQQNELEAAIEAEREHVGLVARRASQIHNN